MRVGFQVLGIVVRLCERFKRKLDFAREGFLDFDGLPKSEVVSIEATLDLGTTTDRLDMHDRTSGVICHFDRRVPTKPGLIRRSQENGYNLAC